MEGIRLKFRGGLADSGQLHLYEFGRSQYATARFVATVENFRRTGRVAQRITSATYIDMRIAAPERGSFIEDILVPSLQQGLAAVVSTPLSALISYVWHLMTPRQPKTDEIIAEIARRQVAIEEQRTQQEAERTKQLEMLRDISNGGYATTKRALDIVASALENNRLTDDSGNLSERSISEAQLELLAEQEREREFAAYRSELEKVDEEDISKLTSKLRGMVGEMALPLRRSADQMHIISSNDNRQIVYLNPEIARQVQRKQIDEELTLIEVRVRSWDRDTGVVKVTGDEFDRPMTVIIPLRNRDNLGELVRQALAVDRVHMLVRRVLDGSGQATSYILSHVEFSHEGDG